MEQSPGDSFLCTRDLINIVDGCIHLAMQMSQILLLKKLYIKMISLYYEYDGKLFPLRKKMIVINYKNGAKVLHKRFTTYFTLHGPSGGNEEWKVAQPERK